MEETRGKKGTVKKGELFGSVPIFPKKRRWMIGGCRRCYRSRKNKEREERGGCSQGGESDGKPINAGGLLRKKGRKHGKKGRKGKEIFFKMQGK